MKTLSSAMIDTIESNAAPKGTWVIISNAYGRNELAERISFYEYEDKFFCVIDRIGYRSKSILYQYDSKEEGNLHFCKIKLKSSLIGCIIRKDGRSK